MFVLLVDYILTLRQWFPNWRPLHQLKASLALMASAVLPWMLTKIPTAPMGLCSEPIQRVALSCMQSCMQKWLAMKTPEGQGIHEHPGQKSRSWSHGGKAEWTPDPSYGPEFGDPCSKGQSATGPIELSSELHGLVEYELEPRVPWP